MINYEDINELKKEKEKLVKEMIEQCKKDGNINTIDTYAHSIKNICKIIEEAENEMGMMDGGYSGNMYSGTPYMMNPQMNDYSWGNGGNYSGARGRGPNASRDSMGRYSSHGDYRSYLVEAMNSAPNDMERQKIQNMLDQMR